MIIIPDIHGRTFWKKAVKNRENEQIIFLGDYLDPYPWEELTEENVINNFLEIIEFKRSHMDNVILLLGNHDFGPYIAFGMCACRTLHNVEYIRQIFEENRDLFQIGYYTTINNINYSFTHSIVLKEWAEDPMVQEYCGKTELPDIIDKLNELWNNDDTNLYRILNFVSWSRGGWKDAGSPIWADVREADMFKPEFEGWYQIFGHSQQNETEFKTDNFACLDCRAAFELTENNKIRLITPRVSIMDFQKIRNYF